MTDKQRILFLCTGNSCRSQMAEGWLRYLAGDCFEVTSAGIEAHGTNPRAVAVMQEAGVDISGQESTILQSEQLQNIDLLVTVCGHADEHCPCVPAQCKKEHWPFDDPARTMGSEDEMMKEFRAVRDEIKQQIQLFIKKERES